MHKGNEEMMGMCGDNCAYCPRYIATKSGSQSELQKVKELWVRLGLRDEGFPVEDMACHGCLPENKCAYEELRACLEEKGHPNCGWCHEYLCQMIKSVFAKSEKLKHHAARACDQEEIEALGKAFFSKKQYLDRIHRVNQRKS